MSRKKERAEEKMALPSLAASSFANTATSSASNAHVYTSAAASSSSVSLSPIKVRPQLFINTTLLNDKDERAQRTFDETDKYSITPTTFKSRSFAKNEPVREEVQDRLKAAASKLQELKTREKAYTSSVQDLINSLKKASEGVIVIGEFTKPGKDLSDLVQKFAPKIAVLTSYLQDLEKYQSFVERNKDLTLSYQDVYQNNTSTVTRFGINTANMNDEQVHQLISIYNPIAEKKEGSVKSGGSKKSAKEDPDTLPTLHPLEVLFISNAISKLTSRGEVNARDASSSSSSTTISTATTGKVVLVDIFARDDKGAIKIEGSKPETHTIVLYAQQNKSALQILVIDPSNSDYSKHLATNTLRVFGRDDLNIEIIVPSKQHKIYASPDKDKVGSNPDQYRDCIDIAVKIAFGLDKFKGVISINDIMSLEPIIEVTNQKDLSDSLFFDSVEAIARIRQASDDNIRAKANKLLGALDKQMQSILDYPGEDTESFSEEIMAKNKAKFNEPLLPSEYENAVHGLHSHFIFNNVLFSVHMSKVAVDLLGGDNGDS